MPFMASESSGNNGDHRITEWLRLSGISGGYLVQPPAWAGPPEAGHPSDEWSLPMAGKITVISASTVHIGKKPPPVTALIFINNSCAGPQRWTKVKNKGEQEGKDGTFPANLQGLWLQSLSKCDPGASHISTHISDNRNRFYVRFCCFPTDKS